MNAQEALRPATRPGVSIDPAFVDQVRACWPEADPAVVRHHFARMRRLADYLHDFTPAQIASHLRLLSEVTGEQLVVASVTPVAGADERDGGAFEVVVAGIDLVGVSACVTGCLAEMRLMIQQMEVATYDPAQEAAEGASPSAAACDEASHFAAVAPGSTPDLRNKYVMALRVAGGERSDLAPLLERKLRARLKAAYWHLVRGDIRRAQLEAEGHDELAGTVLDGRFRVEARLAEGGVGTVYLATQLDLDRPVIVKFLRAEHAANPGFVESFRRETRLLAQAQSPHVVQVYAAGVADGRCWMALEYMSGGDVSHWIARHGTPPAAVAARWLHDALCGLRYIHRELGLVHCDLKPGNLLLDAAGHLKIGDLGLSQLWRLTYLLGPDGSIKGTPWYMSPEQTRGELLDERSDLFSLGSTFFHVLCGAPPFQAASRTELLAKVSRGDRQALSEAGPHVPPPLAVVVERLMAPDPLCRYQAASVALADLESYVHRGLLPARAAGLAEAPLGAPHSARFDAAPTLPDQETRS